MTVSAEKNSWTSVGSRSLRTSQLIVRVCSDGRPPLRSSASSSRKRWVWSSVNQPWCV